MHKAMFLTFVAAILSVIAMLVFEPITLISTAVGLFRFILAALVLNTLLRIMDRINAIEFKEWYKDANAQARAIYFSARLLTLGVLAAFCLA